MSIPDEGHGDDTMTGPRTTNEVGARLGAPSMSAWQLSNGEVHFLWHFVDGAIMESDTRVRLHRAWGMCDRHSFGFVVAESAFRGGFFHGAALLYEDLMTRAVGALGEERGVPARLVARRLRDRAACLMCENGFGPGSSGHASPERMSQAADLERIQRFASETERLWHGWICGRCSGTHRAQRCRKHFCQEAAAGGPSLQDQRALVAELARHVTRYARSFRWELRGTDTAIDRAALVGSIAWCSGWAPWLALAGR